METTLSKLTVREIRAELGRQSLSQRVLASRLGWNQNYLWRRLAGHTSLSLDDIEAIAAVLGVPVEQLVTVRAVA